MKKLVAVLLSLVMVFSALPVFAAESLPEEVLLKVKGKVDVPEELTEFTYSENKYDNVLRYDFNWHTEDYTKELYVSTDSLGRIVTYNYYEQMDYSSDRTLINYTLSDARPLAEETVKTMFPEYFENLKDTLLLKEDKTTTSYSGRYKSFSFTFDRVNNNVIVESNRVVARVRATKDKIYVQSVNAALDEDAIFTNVSNKEALKETPSDYEKKFPIRLYYATDYNTDEREVKLFYSIDKGYVGAHTGEIITQEYFDRYAGITEDSASDMEAGGMLMGKNEATLSPKEQDEIEKMESLVKPDSIEKMLKGLPLLKITDDMVFNDSYTYKNGEEYLVNFSLKGKERNMNVSYNGETGEVISIYSYYTKYDETDIDESEEAVVAPQEEMKAFAKALSGTKIDETGITFTATNKYATMNAERMVNNIPFPENSISVTYDGEKEAVTRYSLYWNEDVAEFPKPEEAIGIEKAREIVFENGVDLVWVKQKEGYVNAITIESGMTINAVTGAEMYVNTDEKVKYTDIDSHWAKDVINILWEHDIYLPGEKFNPDEPITQSDMIRLFSACRDSGVIPIGWEKDRIATYGVENGYIEVAEPDKIMTRREAFKAFVTVLGYGTVAEFDIYKSSYSDMEPMGSAEILKAMGVLVGDTARADDNLTRAEAAVMVYRYLSK